MEYDDLSAVAARGKRGKIKIQLHLFFNIGREFILSIVFLLYLL